MSRLVFALIALSLILCSATASSPDCYFVIGQLGPCAPYLEGTEAKPANTCCKGVAKMKKYAMDKTARQAICRCLKKVAPVYAHIDYSRIPGLPKACGVSINLPAISPAFDCSKA